MLHVSRGCSLKPFYNCALLLVPISISIGKWYWMHKLLHTSCTSFQPQKTQKKWKESGKWLKEHVNDSKRSWATQTLEVTSEIGLSSWTGQKWSLKPGLSLKPCPRLARRNRVNESKKMTAVSRNEAKDLGATGNTLGMIRCDPSRMDTGSLKEYSSISYQTPTGLALGCFQGAQHQKDSCKWSGAWSVPDTK